jgi:hypothetical protein
MPDVNASLQRHLDEKHLGDGDPERGVRAPGMYHVRVVRVAGVLIRKPWASGHLNFSFYTLYVSAGHRDGSK